MKYETKSFIELANKVHNNKYNYSKLISRIGSDIVTIICPEHGEFKQESKYHLRGGGCKPCASKRVTFERTTTLEEFIKVSNEKHNFKYDYSLVKFSKLDDIVKIICPEHGEFSMKAHAHMSTGNNCRKCFYDGRRVGTASFIERSRKIHGDKYDYSLVKCDLTKSKVNIICPKHGKFYKHASMHLKGVGCPKCSREEISTDIINDFLIKANKLFNNKYDYSKINYKDNKSWLTLICPKHGDFKKQAYKHLMGYGCPRCGKYAKMSNDYFKERAIEKHGDLYDYSLIDIKQSKDKIKIICKKHGVFEQVANSHLRGSGCPTCGGTGKLNNEKFIARAKKVHGDLYDYSLVNYTGINKKVKIICKEHGEFSHIASNHLIGNMCPSCGVSKSKGEVAWIKSLNNPNIYTDLGEMKIGKKRIRPDGYDPTTKTIYEFHGDYWHGNPAIYNSNEMNDRAGKTFGELYKRTVDREALIKKAGYSLVTIWESEFKKSLGESTE